MMILTQRRADEFHPRAFFVFSGKNSTFLGGIVMKRRKLLSLLLALCMTFGLTACGGSKTT